MIYSEVIAAGLILPKKAKYTKRDVNNVILNSLFQRSKTFTKSEAKFIVKCSAIFHETNYSKTLI